MYNIVSDCGLQLYDSSCLSGYKPCILVTPNFLSLLSLNKIFSLNPYLPFTSKHSYFQHHVLWIPNPVASHPGPHWNQLHHLEWGDEGPILLQGSLATCRWQRTSPHYCRPRPNCLGHQVGQGSWQAHTQHCTWPESPHLSRPRWPHKGLECIEEGLHWVEGHQLLCGIWRVL